ncbi:hypothetical protein [Mycolicibacterium sp. XJ870]
MPTKFAETVDVEIPPDSAHLTSGHLDHDGPSVDDEDSILLLVQVTITKTRMCRAIAVARWQEDV